MPSKQNLLLYCITDFTSCKNVIQAIRDQGYDIEYMYVNAPTWHRIKETADKITGPKYTLKIDNVDIYIGVDQRYYGIYKNRTLRGEMYNINGVP